MIRMTQGDLLEAKVDALVNTVNTVGVMGKGIALMFKERFPANFHAYARACKSGELESAGCSSRVMKNCSDRRGSSTFRPRQSGRRNSRLEWIELGLKDLVRTIEKERIRSIAIPPLGCGNGGLDWSEVRPLIQAALAGLTIWKRSSTNRRESTRRSEAVEPTVEGMVQGLRNWPGGARAGERKLRILDGRLIDIALRRLTSAAEGTVARQLPSA